MYQNVRWIKTDNIFHLILIILVLSLPFLLAEGLSGPLILDDYPNLSPLLQGNFSSYPEVIFGNNSGPLGRSVSMASFAANHWLVNGMDTYQLKLTGLIIHLLNALLVYCLGIILLKQTSLEKNSVLISFFVATLWLLSPMNISTCFYVIQRMTTLSFLFVMSGCICFSYLRAQRNLARKKQIALISLTIVCWILASFSKETGLLLPLYLLILEVCFFRLDHKNLLVITPKVKIYLISVCSFLLVIGVLVLAQGDVFNYDFRNFTLSQRLMSQPSALIHYLSRLLFPVSADIGIYSDDFELVTSLTEPAGLLNAIVICLIIIGSTYGIVVSNALRPLLSGLLLFFAGHLLESTVIPLELYFEHRNYFPSFGLYLFLVIGIVQLIEKRNFKAYLMVPLVVVYCGCFFVMSVHVSKAWQSYNHFVLNGYINHPLSVRANLDMTQLMINQRQLDIGLKINNNIEKINPDYTFIATIQRFYSYCELSENLPQEEYQKFSNAISLYREEEVSSALNNLLNSYKNKQCKFIDLAQLSEILTSWTIHKLTSGLKSVEQAWVLDYYAVEFLLLSGEKMAAFERLHQLQKMGNEKALFYRQYLDDKK